jgi:hypothetical protein
MSAAYHHSSLSSGYKMSNKAVYISNATFIYVKYDKKQISRISREIKVYKSIRYGYSKVGTLFVVHGNSSSSEKLRI